MPPPLKMASGSVEDIMIAGASGRDGGPGGASFACGSESPVFGSVGIVTLPGSVVVVVAESSTTVFMPYRALSLIFSCFYLFF